MYIAPSCGYICCTYLQVDLHKVNARLQLLMKMSPGERKKHAVIKKKKIWISGLVLSSRWRFCMLSFLSDIKE